MLQFVCRWLFTLQTNNGFVDVMIAVINWLFVDWLWLIVIVINHSIMIVIDWLIDDNLEIWANKWLMTFNVNKLVWGTSNNIIIEENNIIWPSTPKCKWS